MQDVVAPVENIIFDIEVALNNQLGSQPLPFPGMDKSGSAICTFFLTPSGCSKATACPFRHIKGDRTVVCKHWLRGLCKKGDDCEFLHEFDMTKMPECFFFSKYGQCNNKECPFLHIDPEQKMRDCPWYDRGFCRHGPNCKNRHVRRLICQCYLSGFCLDGPKCKYMHPKYDLPVPDASFQMKKALVVCHNCAEQGHKSHQCPKLMQNQGAPGSMPGTSVTSTSPRTDGRPIGAGIPGSGSLYGRGTYSHRGIGRGYHSNLHVDFSIDAAKRLENVTCFKLQTSWSQDKIIGIHHEYLCRIWTSHPMDQTLFASVTRVCRVTWQKIVPRCGEKGHYANRCSKGDLAFLSVNLS